MQRHIPLRRTSPIPKIKQAWVRSKLRVVGQTSAAAVKQEIQALLREHAIKRDGGCVLRHYPEAGACGGYRKDGELILQAEHLVTRSNSASFADMRNIVCLCRHHHGHWKPEHSLRYWKLIERHIGPQRWAWIQSVLDDRSPHRFYLSDWKFIAAVLKRELNQ